MEGGKYGVAFSSGSAVTASILGFLGAGTHVISVNDVYGGTNRYFTKVAVHHEVEVTFVDLTDAAQIKPHFKENTKVKCIWRNFMRQWWTHEWYDSRNRITNSWIFLLFGQLVWIETPTNPTLRIIDIQAIAEQAHAHGAQLVVDNTFMSPYFQNPLSLGADLVVHSVTKYINGHSDVVMGVAVTSNEQLIEKLRFIQNAMGAVPSAFDCYLARRGLMTLDVRMKRHEENALAIAQFLEKHQQVDEVIYPGLPSHPQHELAKRQQRGFGGMVSFRVKGNLDNVNKILSNLKLITLAESLGGVESLIEVPAVMTHAGISPEVRATLGVTDTLLRLSVGIESCADLIKELDQALNLAYL